MSALLNTGVNTPYEVIRRRIDCARRLNDLHEWIETGRVVAILDLSVRKASQAPKVPPIGRLGVSAELLRQLPRGGCPGFFVETLRTLYPKLGNCPATSQPLGRERSRSASCWRRHQP